MGLSGDWARRGECVGLMIKHLWRPGDGGWGKEAGLEVGWKDLGLQEASFP